MFCDHPKNLRQQIDYYQEPQSSAWASRSSTGWNFELTSSNTGGGGCVVLCSVSDLGLKFGTELGRKEEMEEEEEEEMAAKSCLA